ncbi:MULTISPECIES: phosphatase PAP2 family protein [unclassified Moraxella]|uniref:phosphatase PAP2 family protein n=1 Tax=unclassified Moraxella TaxID=2685852 RepID=UPI003AF66B00
MTMTTNPVRMPFGKVIGLTFASSLLLTTQISHAKSDVEKAGDVLSLAIPTVGLGMAVAKDDKAGVKQLGYTLASNLVVTQGLKYATNDTDWGKRPNGEDYSFPSFHTSNACAGATFIGQRYGWQYGSMAMLPATYVGWSRVDANRHHTRDVVAGCAIGIASGLLLTQPYDNTMITPWYENKSLGLSISSQW